MYRGLSWLGAANLSGAVIAPLIVAIPAGAVAVMFVGTRLLRADRASAVSAN